MCSHFKGGFLRGLGRRPRGSPTVTCICSSISMIWASARIISWYRDSWTNRSASGNKGNKNKKRRPFRTSNVLPYKNIVLLCFQQSSFSNCVTRIGTHAPYRIARYKVLFSQGGCHFLENNFSVHNKTEEGIVCLLRRGLPGSTCTKGLFFSRLHHQLFLILKPPFHALCFFFFLLPHGSQSSEGVPSVGQRHEA